MSPTAPTQQREGLGLCSEIIDQLLQSVDCTQHLKDSLGQFLSNITADANHKHLAYHLFCTITLYISKKSTLDDEQMSVLCRTIEQLRREWSDDNVSTKNDTATLSTKGDVISDDAEDVCQALQHCILARSTTPYGFVREMEEWALAPTNFHEAVGSKDTAHLESQYPFGYRVMTRQGWEDKGGLGPHGSGIPSPLDGETLALAYRDPETSTGLGYATKASTKVTENDTFTQATNKRINMVADPASTAWHKYAEDPFAGDLAARSNYVYDETSVPRRAVLSRSLPTETDGNVNIIAQGQWIIEDTWKDTSNHLSDPDSKKDVSEEIPIIKSETIITEPWNFAGSNTSFNGW